MSATRGRELAELQRASRQLLDDVCSISASLSRFVNRLEDVIANGAEMTSSTGRLQASTSDATTATATAPASLAREWRSSPLGETSETAQSNEVVASPKTKAKQQAVPSLELLPQRTDVIMTITFGPHLMSCLTPEQFEFVLGFIESNNLRLNGANFCKVVRGLRAFQTKTTKDPVIRANVFKIGKSRASALVFNETVVSWFPPFDEKIGVTTPKIDLMFPSVAPRLWDPTKDAKRRFSNVQRKWSDPSKEWGPNTSACYELLSDYLEDLALLKKHLFDTNPLSSERLDWFFRHDAWIRVVRTMKWPQELCQPQLSSIEARATQDVIQDVNPSMPDSSSDVEADSPPFQAPPRSMSIAPVPVASPQDYQPLPDALPDSAAKRRKTR